MSDEPPKPTDSNQLSTSEDLKSDTTRPFSLLRETIFVATICNAQLLTQAGLGIAIAPLHIIGKSFGLTRTSSQLSWFPAAYSLTVGTFILFAGRLGDNFGYRRMFIIGWAWYCLWSLLAGISTYSDQIFFDICRAFQGIGPAIVLPNGLAILGRAYPSGTRKDMVFSIFGATAPGGYVLGAVFSSLFAEFLTWSWAYYLLAIYCALLAGLTLLVIPKDETVTRRISLELFDIWGTITGVTGLILVNFAWNQAPIVGWSTPYIYVLLIIGIATLVLFFWIEKHATWPLLPLRQLSTQALYVLACIGAGWGSFGIWVYYLWQFLQVARNHSPLLSTAEYSPIAISGLCAAITTGFLLSRIPPSFIMLAAMLAFLVGSTLIATAPLSQTYWIQTFIAIIIMPWGMVTKHPPSKFTCAY